MLDRVLSELNSEDYQDICQCDPSHQGSSPQSASSSTLANVWSIYEDVCVICAGLWMGAWRNTLTPALAGLLRHPDSWANTRLEARTTSRMCARAGRASRAARLVALPAGVVRLSA